MLRLISLLLAAAMALLGCDGSGFADLFIPKEEAAQAQDFVARLAARDYPAIEAVIDPALKTPELRGQLEKMVSLVPAGSPKSVRTVGALTMKGIAGSTYDLTLEYEYPEAWLMARVVLQKRDGQLSLKGIYFEPRSQSMAAQNRFTLDGKGALHYIVLTLAVVVPLFILYALVLCFRTRFEKRKWLWLLFVAVGLVQFQLDWTSGAWRVQLFSFVLFGAGIAKSGPVAPWVLTVSLPVGALIFMLRRHAKRAAAAEAAAEQANQGGEVV